jgi:hypothetical protein
MGGLLEGRLFFEKKRRGRKRFFCPKEFKNKRVIREKPTTEL